MSICRLHGVGSCCTVQLGIRSLDCFLTPKGRYVFVRLYELLIVVFVAKVCSTKKLREPSREDLERKKELLRMLGHLDNFTWQSVQRNKNNLSNFVRFLTF